MKTTFISTLSLWNSPRTALTKMQEDLAKSNKEIATGRYADVGLELGYRTGHGISLRQERAELEALTDSNATVSLRLSATKLSMEQIRGTAETFLATLVPEPSKVVETSVIVSMAKRNLEELTSELNSSTGGQFIFAGTNVKKQPVNAYESTPTSAAKNAVDTAFLAQFGFSQTSPVISTITPAAMNTFLDGNFKTLFDDAAWKAAWSTASSQNIESLISANEKVETSANANEAGFRRLAMAYTMASDLGLEGLSADTRAVVISKIVEVMGSATTDLVQIQANLGATEKKVTDSNEKMRLQKDVLDKGVIDLEDVDPAEAKAKVDALTTQIQMSYSLTSQLRQLSLINYL